MQEVNKDERSTVSVTYEDYNSYMKDSLDSYELDTGIKKPNWIIGIARGGLPLMDYATRRYETDKYAIIPTQVYLKGLERLLTPRFGDFTYCVDTLNADKKSSTEPKFSGKILIVDDILDSGTTLGLVYKKVKENSLNADIHVAVVMKKPGPYVTEFTEEIKNCLYCTKVFPKNCYIIQPFEDPKKLARFSE